MMLQARFVLRWFVLKLSLLPSHRTAGGYIYFIQVPFTSDKKD